MSGLDGPFYEITTTLGVALVPDKSEGLTSVFNLLGH